MSLKYQEGKKAEEDEGRNRGKKEIRIRRKKEIGEERKEKTDSSIRVKDHSFSYQLSSSFLEGRKVKKEAGFNLPLFPSRLRDNFLKYFFPLIFPHQFFPLSNRHLTSFLKVKTSVDAVILRRKDLSLNFSKITSLYLKFHPLSLLSLILLPFFISLLLASS